MSFFLTLPSTSSMDIFPQNTTSSFTTVLQSPLRLEGSWQVALTSFSYRLNISMYLGCTKIYKLDTTVCPNCWKYLDKIDFFAYEGEKYSELVSRMSKKFQEFRDPTQPELSDIFELISQENKLMFKTDKFRPYMVIFDGRIADILNLIDQSKIVNDERLLGKYQYKTNDTISIDYHPDVLVNHNEFFFFYTDIITDQYVGDIRSKLLETMAIEGVREKSVTIVNSNPNYVDVAYTEIPTINITIKNSLGENIRFNHFSRVIVKLHFRPKRYE